MPSSDALGGELKCLWRTKLSNHFTLSLHKKFAHRKNMEYIYISIMIYVEDDKIIIYIGFGAYQLWMLRDIHLHML